MSSGERTTLKLKILLACGLTIILGVWLWLRPSFNPSPSAPNVSLGDASSSDLPALVPPSTAPAQVILQNEGTSKEPGLPLGELILRFQVYLEDGSMDSSANGRVAVIWNRTHKWGRQSVEIRGGAGVLLPPQEKEAVREKLEFDYLRLNGRRARALDEPKLYPSASELTVDCEYLPGSTLAVYDCAGCPHASGLQLVTATSVSEGDLEIPVGSAAIGNATLSSPIALADRDGTIVYFLRSKDSAWSRVAVDHESPGIRTVFLRPGGRVEFAVQAASLSQELRLRIYRVRNGAADSGRPIAECTLSSDGRGLIEGLQVGDWEVRAEYGSASYGNAVLGSERFTVVANSATNVELSVIPLPPIQEAVRVKGIVLLPEPFLEDRSRLFLQAQD